MSAFCYELHIYMTCRYCCIFKKKCISCSWIIEDLKFILWFYIISFSTKHCHKQSLLFLMKKYLETGHHVIKTNVRHFVYRKKFVVSTLRQTHFHSSSVQYISKMRTTNYVVFCQFSNKLKYHFCFRHNLKRVCGSRHGALAVSLIGKNAIAIERFVLIRGAQNLNSEWENLSVVIIWRT